MFIPLNRDTVEPLYLQVYTWIRDQIVSGDLPPGTRLPSERDLALDLNVSRTTVSNAYAELFADGLIQGQVGRGTMVCTLPPAFIDDERRASLPFDWGKFFLDSLVRETDSAVQELVALSARQDLQSLACGVPDSGVYPTAHFTEAIHSVLAEQSDEALSLCPVEGVFSFREMLAELSDKAGIGASPGNVLVLAGSQQGLDLVARAFLRPGDTVLVESPTYLGALAAFRPTGARIIGIPLDHDGMRIDLLEQAIIQHRPRLIYTVPTFHNPTGSLMSAARREHLVALARRYQVPILEDDPYGFLHYDAPPPTRLKALDRHGYVMYLGTFSKMLMPGLRIGWMIAAQPVIDRLTTIKQYSDIHSNSLAQLALVAFARRGWLDEHIERCRRVYPSRRDAMLAALEAYMPEDVEWLSPTGGFYIWCRLPDYIRAGDLLIESVERGVSFAVGEAFYPDGAGKNTFRLTYVSQDEKQITDCIRIIGESLTALLRQKRYIRMSMSRGTIPVM